MTIHLRQVNANGEPTGIFAEVDVNECKDSETAIGGATVRVVTGDKTVGSLTSIIVQADVPKGIIGTCIHVGELNFNELVDANQWHAVRERMFKNVPPEASGCALATFRAIDYALSEISTKHGL